jgi:hypothetical protein
MNYTQRDLGVAWAAGIFEGEGTCGVSSRWGQAHVSITSTDKDVADKFMNIVGVGSVYLRKDHRKDTYKPAYKWAVQSAEDVISVLELLMPFLCERRTEQTTAVLLRAREIASNKEHRLASTRTNIELLKQLGLIT